MRHLILTLSLAMAVPMIPSMAAAEGHSCNQLRQGVMNLAPPATRNLPYHALPCSAISELHLLIQRRSQYSTHDLQSRVEAVFRREGLIR